MKHSSHCSSHLLTPLLYKATRIESVAVMFLGLLVVITSGILLERIRYLQGFLPVCRWCRKIKVGDQWMSITTYLEDYTEEAASFGLCPSCAEKRQAIQASLGRRQEPPEQGADGGPGDSESE